MKNPSDGIARVTGKETLVLSWKDVLDTDSGILLLLVTLCPDPKLERSMSHFKCVSIAEPDLQKQDVTVELSGISMKHNETYWLVLEVVNHAHLASRASIPILVDRTKPTVGIVEDGDSSEDIACQRSCTTVSAHWQGFLDEESDIINYEWAVGFQPFASNVLPFTPVDYSAGYSRASLKSDINISNNTVLYSTVRVCSLPHILLHSAISTAPN
jgi:hypothetical protein